MSTDSTGGRPANAGPTLYLESDEMDPAETFCTEILDDNTSGEYRVVQLTSARSFDSLSDSLDVQLERVNDPAEAAVIILSPQSGEDSTASEVGEGTPFYGFWVDPQDLTGISVAFSQLIDRWEESEGTVRICLRNVESLFPYHDADLVYRFLNTVLATLQGAGADVHAHLRPSAIEDRPLEMLSSLFADVVESGSPTDASATADDVTEADRSTGTDDAPDTADAGVEEASQDAPSTMSDAEIDSHLESAGYGILAFDGSPPYAIPMSYGYDADERVCYLQLSSYEDSEKQSRLADSEAVSLVVSRYAGPDRWFSVVVDGTLTRLSDEEVREREVHDVFADSELATVDVFTRDLSDISFEWYVLESTAFSGRRGVRSP